MKRIFIIFLFLSLWQFCCYASDMSYKTGQPLPRFISLKFDKTNVRNGPGKSNAIKWTYLRKGYPLEVTAEFDNWREVRDIDGTKGWINQNLITNKRNVIIINNELQETSKRFKLKPQEMVLFSNPSENSYPKVRVEFGVIANIKKCELEWCKVQVEKYTGWIRKFNLWGVYKDEIIG